MTKCRSDSDRRQREGSPPLGIAERRVRAERRNFDVAPASLEAWSQANSNYYFLHHRRRGEDRRKSVSSLPPGFADRRVMAERRDFSASDIPLEEWVEEMSQYYGHFHRA
jgi:hypothetical protein